MSALIFQMLPNNTNTISDNPSRTNITIRVIQKENDDDEKVNNNTRLTCRLWLSVYKCNYNIITTLLLVFNCVRNIFYFTLYNVGTCSINKANALKWARILSSKNTC